MTASLFVFVIAVIGCFSIPGIVFISGIKPSLNSWEKIIFGTIVGFVLFTLIGFLGMRTQLFFLPIGFIIISSFFIRSIKIDFLAVLHQNYKKLFLFLIIFILGVVGQLAIIAPSGLKINSELVFWSSHGHDGMWHLSLMGEIKRGGELKNPILANEKLYNYHFFSDIAPAFFNMYFKLDSLDLYFRLFPLLYSILFGSSIFLLCLKIDSFSGGLWGMFFAYFAGSFGYIVTWIQGRTIGGESLFWATQPQSSSGNPPQIVAFFILITIFLLMNYYLKNLRDIRLFLVISLLLASLMVIKIYAFILISTALLIVSLWQIFYEKKLYLLLLLSFSTFLAIGLYLPYSKGVGNFLIFEPWWFIRTMVVAPDRLNWLDLELRRQTYMAEHNWKRVVQLELTAFLIFLFGNLGMRLLGFWEFLNLGKILKPTPFRILYFSTLLLSLLIPLLLLQKGVAGNTAQFLQYFLLLSGILAAITTNSILSKLNFSLRILLGLVIVFLAIPTQVGLIYQFYSHPPLARISQNELSALDFLRKNTESNSIIASPSYNKDLNLHDRIPNIWDWSDSSYVSALSGRRSFLVDQEQLSIMDYDQARKLKELQTLFSSEDSSLINSILDSNRINIIYFPLIQKPKADLTKSQMIKIYSNLDFEVWEKI